MQFSLNEYLSNLGTTRSQTLLNRHGDSFDKSHYAEAIGTTVPTTWTLYYPQGSSEWVEGLKYEAERAYKASKYFEEALTIPEQEACILETITPNLFRNNRGDFIHVPTKRGEAITLFANKWCTLGAMMPTKPRDNSFEEYRRWRQEVSFFRARLAMEARERLKKSPEHVALVLEALTFEPDSPHIDTLFANNLLEHGWGYNYHADVAYDLMEHWIQCVR